MIEKIKRLIEFLTVDIWRMRLSQLTGKRSLLIRTLRVMVISGRDFHADKCLLRASALTFYTMLSLVPVLALAFAIARAFNLAGLLENHLRVALQGQEGIADWIINFTQQQLNKAEGGVIAGVGVIVLFWAAVRLLTFVERSLNDIWAVKKPRSFTRRVSDYISVAVIVPILLLASVSAMVLIQTKLSELTQDTGFAGLIHIFFSIAPLAMSVMTFLFIYKMMPNTKVTFRSALIGAVVAGTAFLITQWVYFKFQVGVTKYSAVYGSLAALPAFLVWIQLTWVILLFGAELSFAHQNVSKFEYDADCANASPRLSKLVSLHITQLIVQNFMNGKQTITARELSNRTDLPIRLVNDVLSRLIDARILVETNTTQEHGYLPAHPPEAITVASVLSALDRSGVNEIPLRDSPELTKVVQALEGVEESAQKSKANIVLKDV